MAQKRPDYKALNNRSTASELEILATCKKRRNDVYQAEEVLAEKKVSLHLILRKLPYE